MIHPKGRDALAPRPLSTPHPDRLSADRPDYELICARHEAAMAAGERGYMDPATGFFVMTAANHAERGFCCDSGCRHCPYVQ